MKFVKLQRTAMIGGQPRSPAEGAQLVSNRQAEHMVDMGDVLKDDVTDAPGIRDEDDHVEHGSDDAGAKDNKKALAAALKKQTADQDKIFDQKVAAEVEKQVAARHQEDFDKAVAAKVEEVTAPKS